MKGIIYTRVSSDEQVKGTSLEFQEDLCRKYCEQKGIEIVSLFREEGESAKDLSLNNRKKFLEALEYCRMHKNQISAFIVLRVDRFARNTEDHFAVRKILLGYGTTLHSVTEPIGNKPAEKFIETVLAGAAEYDNAIRKQRCTDGMLSRINQGLFPWKPPIGYACLNAKKRGEKKTEPDPPDEQRFEIIQHALKEFASGLYTQSELARKLHDWGLRTTHGKKVGPQLVNRMLTKYLPFYAGIIINPWTREDVKGKHKAMIDKEEMLEIQLIHSGKQGQRNVKREKLNPLFPLRKTVRCGECNYFLTASTSKGKGGNYLYYHCYNKSCSVYGKSISKGILEKEFQNYLEKISPAPEFLKAINETVIDVWKNEEEKHKGNTEKLKKQLPFLEEKLKRIYEMREEGTYSKEDFLMRKESIENEITSIKGSVTKNQTNFFEIKEVLDYVSQFIRNLSQEWPWIPPKSRIRFDRLIFPDGIAYYKNKGFGTPKLGHIYSLNQHFPAPNSRLVDPASISWNVLIEELLEFKAAHEEMMKEISHSKAA